MMWEAGFAYEKDNELQRKECYGLDVSPQNPYVENATQEPQNVTIPEDL